MERRGSLPLSYRPRTVRKLRIGSVSVQTTHRLPNEHYEAVGDAYAARELPGGLKVMFGLKGKWRVREAQGREGQEGEEKREAVLTLPDKITSTIS
jgi:hypothetical protein